jgi:hypothetical protein
MKSISKTMLRTCAGLAAAAALVVGGAGMASAATTSPAHSHFGFFGCNPWQREQWNLNGNNTVDNNQFSPAYTYSITFKQSGSCLSGWMTDGYFPTTQPIHGTVYGNQVTFSFTYPSSYQGTRTFTGSINKWGYVSGNWTETGTEGASSTWSLANKVHRACPWWYWPGAACQVHP